MSRNKKCVSLIEVVSSVLVLICMVWLIYSRAFSTNPVANPVPVATQAPVVTQAIPKPQSEVQDGPLPKVEEPQKNPNHFGFVIGHDTYDSVLSRVKGKDVEIKRTLMDDGRPALALFHYKPFDELTKSKGERVIEMGQGSRGSMLIFNKDDKLLMALHIYFDERNSPPTVFPILLAQLTEKYGAANNSSYNQMKKSFLYSIGNEVIILSTKMEGLGKHSTSLSYNDKKYYFDGIDTSAKEKRANINPNL